jgi:hypothetical protein
VDTAFDQSFHRARRPPDDFVGVIEVRVNADILVHGAAALGDSAEGVDPCLIRQDLLREDTQALGGESKPADIWQIEEAETDEFQVL